MMNAFVDIRRKAEYWAFSSDFEVNTNKEIQYLLQKQDEDEITDRFYKDLEFGTGGMRGIIAEGTNRINLYTIRRATQGFANYLLSTKQKLCVAISYDNRKFSEKFAQETACIFAANGIFVWIFSQLTPTPILSFAIRALNLDAGVMITASHNPRNYNGYKVFQSDGSQIIAPQDIQIFRAISQITSYSQIKGGDWTTFLTSKQISFVPQSLFEDYYTLLEQVCFNPKEQNASLGVVYSPLHGAGKIPVAQIMQRRGFRQFHLVLEQQEPDANFSTLRVPNPEDSSVMDLAIKTAKKTDTLILVTDPDADRIGVMSKHQEKWVFLNGNQIGQLLLYHRLKTLRAMGMLPTNGVFITTIVTSRLHRKIAESFGLQTYEGLTGFKYIAQIMRALAKDKKQEFIFACEESNGYLANEQIRDKDGVMAAVIFAEMAAQLGAQGVLGLLTEVYQEYGYHRDTLINFTFQGKKGVQKIASIMEALRQNTDSIFPQEKIVRKVDYQNSAVIAKMQRENFFFLGDNVFACYLANGSRITARPSGTEPKIKFYLNLTGGDFAFLKEKEQLLKQAIEQFIENYEDTITKG